MTSSTFAHTPMRLLNRALIISLCASATFVAAAAGSSATRPLGGLITDAATAQPITSVQVTVRGTRLGSVTSANGAFLIPDAPADSVQLSFRHPCYLRVDVVVPAGEAGALRLGMPQDAAAAQRAGCGGLGANRRGTR